MSTIVT